MSKTKYTFEQHQKLGEEFFLMRERLLQLSCDLDRNYNRKYSNLATTAQEAIDTLRYQLDSVVFDENPELKLKDLAGAYLCANRLKDQE